MHEGTVCTEIVKIVERAAAQHGIQIVYEIVIVAGPYSCLNEKQLNFYLPIAGKGTCAEGAVIRLEQEESLIGAAQMYVKSFRGE